MKLIKNHVLLVEGSSFLKNIRRLCISYEKHNVLYKRWCIFSTWQHQNQVWVWHFINLFWKNFIRDIDFCLSLSMLPCLIIVKEKCLLLVIPECVWVWTKWNTAYLLFLSLKQYFNGNWKWYETIGKWQIEQRGNHFVYNIESPCIYFFLSALEVFLHLSLYLLWKKDYDVSINTGSTSNSIECCLKIYAYLKC